MQQSPHRCDELCELNDIYIDNVGPFTVYHAPLVTSILLRNLGGCGLGTLSNDRLAPSFLHYTIKRHSNT